MSSFRLVNETSQSLRSTGALECYTPSTKEDKDQDSIQSSTTPDPGYQQWESDNFTNERQEVSPVQEDDHKASINRRARTHNKKQDRNKINDPRKKHCLGTNNPADNLLKADGTHKWKCATAGEKSISAVLQLEKASQIQSIDIGNEGSAFVEILVGRSSASSDQDYQVLLVASAFMSPLEARNNTNRNGVRMFGVDKFSKTVLNEKWDRVKIVCTQPFNKTSTFGLSFIKFHSPGDPSEKESKPVQKTVGHFKLKNGDEEDIHSGSLFANRGKSVVTTTPAPLSGAAAVRAASRLAEESKHSVSASSIEKKTSEPSTSVKASTSATNDKSSSSVKPEKKAELQKKEVKSTPSPSQNREKRKHKVSDDDDTEEEVESKPPLRKQTTSLSSVSSKASSKDEDKPPLKKIKSEPPKESPVKAFSRIMEKVVFAMSGYQNPYRGELRDRAVAMGAKYKPDWGKGCTHLICAFPNTPKYNQVDGKGKIVSQKWIQECYKQKKLLPWRKFRVGDAESPSEESSSEDDYAPTPKKVTPKKTPSKPETKKPTPATKSKQANDDDDGVYGGDTDSGEDTEDELRKAKAKITTPTKGKQKDDDFDPYGADTDEDEGKPGTSKKHGTPGTSKGDDGSDSGLPDLPDFFTDKKFFFYGKIDNKERRLLTRYITAYDGEVEDYMSDKINYVVTSSAWDDNFDEALSENTDLIFVKPKWIHVCHDKSKLMPHQPYIVVPAS